MRHLHYFHILFLFCQFLSVKGSPINDFVTPAAELDSSKDFSKKLVSGGKLTPAENEELKNLCGYYQVSKKKSIGSESAVRKQAPWVVGIAIKQTSKRDGVILSRTYETCSGTLISKRHVLTAWHCVSQPDKVKIFRKREGEEVEGDDGTIYEEPASYVEEIILEETGVTLDKFRFVFDDDCSASFTFANCSIENATIREAVKAISPKLYMKFLDTGNKDVAIFELNEPVEFAPDLYPACLSDTSPIDSDVLDLYSFGSDNRTNAETLNGALQHIQLETESCTSADSIDSICIKMNKQRSDHGDSGGGLIYKKYGKRYVTGVISGENQRGIRNVAVANHLRWICKHTGICVNETKTEQITTLINTITLE